MTIVHLEVNSYRGISPGAIHYYGRLRGKDPAAFVGIRYYELRHLLTETEAAARNLVEIEGGGRPRYRAGQSSTGFDTSDQIIDLAIAIYKDAFPDATLLLLGNAALSEPMPVLDGPKNVMAEGNQLVATAQAASKAGGYERPALRNWLNELSAAWERLIKPFEN